MTFEYLLLSVLSNSKVAILLMCNWQRRLMKMGFIKNELNAFVFENILSISLHF